MRREEENESNNDNEHAADSGGLDAPTAATSVCAVCCTVLIAVCCSVLYCAVLLCAVMCCAVCCAVCEDFLSPFWSSGSNQSSLSLNSKRVSMGCCCCRC